MQTFINLVVATSLVTSVVTLIKRNRELKSKCIYHDESHHEEIKEKEIVEVVKDCKTIVQCLFYDPDQNLVEKNSIC